MFLLLLLFSPLAWWPRLDQTTHSGCYIGQAVLCWKRIFPITNRSEKANQNAAPAWELDVSARQRAVWTPSTGGWRWDLEMYKRSLESSHCCSHRKTFHHLFSAWDFVLQMITSSASCSTRSGELLKNCSRFPHPSLSSFFHAWHPVGVDKHLPFEGNNPLKEEPGPIDVLPLEQISKAAHEREEHHVFCGERICKIIQPDGLLNATLPCSQWTLGTF